MNISVHQRIRNLLEETTDAFTCYDAGSADFADFAALALSEFKNVLSDPHLTHEQLVHLLRRGMAKHKDKDPNSWSAFMAHHIARAVNSNTPRVSGVFTNNAWETAGEAQQA